jgi:hypothetical protein
MKGEGKGREQADEWRENERTWYVTTRDGRREGVEVILRG